MIVEILPLVPIALAILAAIKNIRVTKSYNRVSFLIIFALVSAPLIIIAAYDIASFLNADIKLPLNNITTFVFVYLAIVSYPFYQRVCWRINDASINTKSIVLAYVPYFNFLFFLYLCFKKTRNQTETDSN